MIGGWDYENLFDLVVEGSATLIFLAVISLVCLFAAAADRQRREGGGSRRRLWAVSLAATTLTLLPLSVGLLALSLDPDRDPVVFAPAICLSVVAGFGVVPALKPPVYFQNQTLPLVTDESILSRLAVLATRMKLAVPTVRLFRTASCDLQAQAWAGGLPQPSLVVTDGILHRLEPVECDTIVAHELAHIANSSLWVYAALLPLCCAIGVVAFASDVATWMWIVPASYVGVRRILSRHFEYDCDVRAAQVVGFPGIATALSKLHKLSLGAEMTWPMRLMFATEGHPALVNRLAHLARLAHEVERPRMPTTTDSVTVQTRLAWLSAVVWLMAMILGWKFGQIHRHDTLIASAALLTVVSLTPRAIRFWSLRPKGASLWSRQRLREVFIFGVPFALVVAGLGVFYFAGGRDGIGIPVVPGSLSAGLIVVAAVMLYRQAHRLERRNEFDLAWNQLDFARVVNIAESTPSWLARDTDRSCQAVVAKAALGQFNEALEDLEQFDRGDRLDEGNRLYLCVLQIEVEQFDEALQTAARIREESPNSAIGEALAARIFRRLGRLDEAREQVGRALELSPHSGSIWAGAAGIEIDSGNYDRAREFLARAQELEPGTPQELAETARLAICVDPPSMAREKLQRAIIAYEANPLMLRPSEIRLLRVALQSLTDETL